MLRTALKVLGALVAVAAVVLCARALIQSWPIVRAGLIHARIWILLVALLASAVGVCGLAWLWQRTLKVFDRRYPLGQAASWFFAGELGKYVPGSVWAVVGRGELAHRAGVGRSTAYSATLMSMALMCVGGGVACGVLVPFLAVDGGRTGPEIALALLVPLGVIFAFPQVHGPIFTTVSRLTKGRLSLRPTTWWAMFGLILAALPTWVFVGGASVLITAALGYPQNPARVAFAAIAAWLIGFLAVPVPAGAGVRELLFVLSSGLDQGAAVAVAALARVMLIFSDGVAGVISLGAIGAAGKARSGFVAPAPAREEPEVS